MPRAQVHNCDLYYEVAGQGPTVVYVHGGFAGLDTVLRDAKAQAWSWEHDFAAALRFISYERRGCARSSSPDNGYDLVQQARDLAGLLEHLQLDSAHIIGSSAGGPIAFTFAALCPRRTRSLVLTGTAIIPCWRARQRRGAPAIGRTGTRRPRRCLRPTSRWCRGALTSYGMSLRQLPATTSIVTERGYKIAARRYAVYRQRSAYITMLPNCAACRPTCRPGSGPLPPP